MALPNVTTAAGAESCHMLRAIAYAKLPSAAKRPQGPQMKVVDGVIVVDEQSLQMDRQAEGEAERADFEEIEENEFTRVVTSSSFRRTSQPTPACAELFDTPSDSASS